MITLAAFSLKMSLREQGRDLFSEYYTFRGLSNGCPIFKGRLEDGHKMRKSEDVYDMAEKKTLSLYLHFPFCLQKCRYCDFLSFPAEEDVRKSYVERLLQEIWLRGQELAERQVQTIFIGGGTPSLMSAGQLSRIMEAVYRVFSVESDAEISMECNPGTIMPGGDSLSFKDMFRCGINRLSIGLQSAENSELSILGRIHSYEQFLDNYEQARRAGFSNINVDLMSGLPGQTLDSWMKTLESVKAMDPEHISAYSLIIEDGTPFGEIYGKDMGQEAEDNGVISCGRGECTGLPGHNWPPLPDEEEERQMYDQTESFLAAAGYRHYEISNYAKPGYECRHNLAYWYRGDYLGLGLGAASLVDERRFTNTRDLRYYLKGRFSDRMDSTEGSANSGEYDSKAGQFEKRDAIRLVPVRSYPALSEEEQMEETMFLGLRCAAGVGKEAFAARFGREMDDVYGNVIRKYAALGLLEDIGTGIRLTKQGVSVSNVVMADFLLN